MEGGFLSLSHSCFRLLPSYGSTTSMSFIVTPASSSATRKRSESIQGRFGGSVYKWPTSLDFPSIGQSSDTWPWLAVKEAGGHHPAAPPLGRRADADGQLVVSVPSPGFFLQPQKPSPPPGLTGRRIVTHIFPKSFVWGISFMSEALRCSGSCRSKAQILAAQKLWLLKQSSFSTLFFFSWAMKFLGV